MWLSHLEEGGGGTQRCTARSKLPGINLEATARRMECRGGKEGWSQVPMRRWFTWQKSGAWKTRESRVGWKEERVERGIDARDLDQHLALIWRRREEGIHWKKFKLDSKNWGSYPTISRLFRYSHCTRSQDWKIGFWLFVLLWGSGIISRNVQN